jgi:nitrite reductase/ring-hydroxylating ferredoxin subunit
VATLTTDLIGPLCRVDDLPDGHSRGFDPLGEGHDSMFIVRQGARLHAWRNACPHYDRARMAWKKDEFLNADRSQIVCGAHGAMFRIDTGECTIGPCLGQRLRAVELVQHEGAVYVVAPFAPSRPQRKRPNAS